MNKQPYTLEQRALLAKEVFQATLDMNEVLSDDNVGVELAYLMGSILNGPPDAVDWSDWVEGPDIIREQFEERFPANHPVWQFIIREDETCHNCGKSRNDGEGYDGLCGNCADKAEASK